MSIKAIKGLWNKLMGRGHERTVKAKKNIFQAVLFKGLGVLLGFIYVPLTAGYLGEYKYGIFILFASLLEWFEELDLGIGNGLRNRFGEAIADGNESLARAYVSTAYFILGAIFSVASLVIIAACFFIPWSDLINSSDKVNGTGAALVTNEELILLAILMFAAFAIRFVSSLVYQIFYALQKAGMVDLFAMVGKVGFLFVMLLLIYFTNDSLLLFGMGKTFTFALVPLLVGFYFFNNAFRPYRPSLKLASREHFKGLFTLGMQFFLIKSSMIVIYSTNAFLITSFVGVEQVPQYDSAYKYMSVFILFFNIITNQMWSANTEAYRKGDMQWMKNAMKKINLIWAATLVAAGFMILVSPWVYQIWLRGTVTTPTILLTFAIGVSVCITTWVNSYNIVINGTGKVRLQMYTWIITAILNIPFCYFFAVVLDLDMIGIVLGTIVCMIPLAILSPIQVYKLLNKTDRGVWAK
jgi:O-antigen/teichoic acid export membrane protein